MVKHIYKGKGEYILTKRAKPLRCKVCNKALYEKNQSGLCNIHFNLEASKRLHHKRLIKKWEGFANKKIK